MSFVKVTPSPCSNVIFSELVVKIILPLSVMTVAAAGAECSSSVFPAFRTTRTIVSSSPRARVKEDLPDLANAASDMSSSAIDRSGNDCINDVLRSTGL